MFIDANNTLYIFGSNTFGQLGSGDTDNRFKPIKHPSLANVIDISTGGFHSFVKTGDNEIYAFGRNDYSQLGIEANAGDYFQLIPTRVFEADEKTS